MKNIPHIKIGPHMFYFYFSGIGFGLGHAFLGDDYRMASDNYHFAIGFGRLVSMFNTWGFWCYLTLADKSIIHWSLPLYRKRIV